MCFYKIQRRESEKENKFVWWVFFVWYIQLYTILVAYFIILVNGRGPHRQRSVFI